MSKTNTPSDDDDSGPAIAAPLIAVSPAQGKLPSIMERLAEIPEEKIWLSKQKSARTRRAYQPDVPHFMATIGIATSGELRQVDHRAVIAWERHMREVERGSIDGAQAPLCPF